MEVLLLVIHVVVAVALVTFVLLQQGKGADAGAAFGSGASSTVFGSRGSTSFLSRTTAILAAIFFATSLWLAYYSTAASSSSGSVTGTLGSPVEVEQRAPARSDSDLPTVPPEE